MRRILLCITTLIVVGACTQEVKKEPELGGISGVVSDKTTGDPVSVVNVKLKEIGASTVTGTDGSFSFKDLTDGTYTVQISKEGYKENSSSVVVSSGRTTESHLLIERIPAILTLDREVLDFGDNYSNTTLSFSMVNKNYVDLDWEIVYDCKWIREVNPIKSLTKLGFGKTQTVVVIIDREELQPGNNETVIVVRTSDGASDIKIKATGQEKKLAALNILETTDIKASTAIIHAEIIDNGLPEYKERGFVIGDSSMPIMDNAIKVIPAAVNAEKEFSVKVEGLMLGVSYYVRAYAVNSVGVAYSTNQDIFTTAIVPPELSEFVVVEQDWKTGVATLRATIAYEGDPPFIERGFYWSMINEGQISSNSEKIVVEGTSATFQKVIEFPSADHPIYVGAYIMNDGGLYSSTPVEIFPIDYVSINMLGLGVHRQDISSMNVDWGDADSMCRSSRIGGYDDWRLPTLDELYRLYSMKDDIGGFTDTSAIGSCYWSTDLIITQLSTGLKIYNFYYVCFYDGHSGYIANGNDNRARCVRTLQQ